MSRTAVLVMSFEVVGYGVLLNFGYPYDTLRAALVALSIIAGTWAVDRLVSYLRERRRPY